jgi:hypothetical protein
VDGLVNFADEAISVIGELPAGLLLLLLLLFHTQEERERYSFFFTFRVLRQMKQQR